MSIHETPDDIWSDRTGLDNTVRLATRDAFVLECAMALSQVRPASDTLVQALEEAVGDHVYQTHALDRGLAPIIFLGAQRIVEQGVIRGEA